MKNSLIKIRTHRYENEKWGRAHLPFFKKFDKYLSQYFEVESINYNKDGNTFNGNINLIKDVGGFGKNPPLSDVDCVIENIETGETKLISFTEYFNSYSCHVAKSENCTKTLLSHFNWHNIYYWMKRENAISQLHKIKPWIFLPFQEFDVLSYRLKRNSIQDYENKMFWLGSGVDAYRKMIRIIEQKGFLQPIISTSHEDYLEKIINSKVGLSYYLDLDKYNTPYDHPGEFCYRDVEYISLGVPFIRIEFKDVTHNPLLPNYHYISIPREHAYVAYEKNGDEGIADLYINRYKEVINDNEFLDYISKNQLEWSENNIINDSKEKLTFDLLELNRWSETNVVTDSEKKLNFELLEVDTLPENGVVVDSEEKLNLELLEVDRFTETNVITDSVEKINVVRGHTGYRGYTAQQHENVFGVFKEFLKKIKPSQILEIGTAGGGFTLFLRDALNEIGLENTQIKSFDVVECAWYDKIRENNIEINIENIFDQSYLNLEKPERIFSFIRQEGTTLVLCDGGHKIIEFNKIAPFIKPGDFIMAHDYVDTYQNYIENFLNKIWNWCEIEEKYIDQVSKDYNLVHYDKENFDKVVWVCKQKI